MDLAEYIIFKVLDSKIEQGKLGYLIDWEGYGPEECTWKLVENIHAPTLVQTFHRSYPEKPGTMSCHASTLHSAAKWPPAVQTTGIHPPLCTLKNDVTLNYTAKFHRAQLKSL
uniref:Chromo domain-containing protein n=1 Tax=Chelonoidis abingdonii TaxID=106734 RepID=A0A8C0ILD1_CHEAB